VLGRQRTWGPKCGSQLCFSGVSVVSPLDTLVVDFIYTVVLMRRQRMSLTRHNASPVSWLFYRFNRTLMNQRGVAMGQEFRGKGVNVQLGPHMCVNLSPISPSLIASWWPGISWGRPPRDEHGKGNYLSRFCNLIKLTHLNEDGAETHIFLAKALSKPCLVSSLKVSKQLRSTWSISRWFLCWKYSSTLRLDQQWAGTFADVKLVERWW
jgi:hypothetical protein